MEYYIALYHNIATVTRNREIIWTRCELPFPAACRTHYDMRVALFLPSRVLFVGKGRKVRNTINNKKIASGENCVEMQAMMHLNLSVNMKIANNLHQNF